MDETEKKMSASLYVHKRSRSDNKNHSVKLVDLSTDLNSSVVGLREALGLTKPRFKSIYEVVRQYKQNEQKESNILPND